MNKSLDPTFWSILYNWMQMHCRSYYSIVGLNSHQLGRIVKTNKPGCQKQFYGSLYTAVVLSSSIL